MQLNIKPCLGHVRNSVPVASTDRELPPAYSGQDLFWSVTGPVCKWSAAEERREQACELLSCIQARKRLQVAVTHEETSNLHSAARLRARGSLSPLLPSNTTEALTLQALCKGELPGSRCHSPHRSLAALVPGTSKQRRKSV